MAVIEHKYTILSSSKIKNQKDSTKLTHRVVLTSPANAVVLLISWTMLTGCLLFTAVKWPDGLIW